MNLSQTVISRPFLPLNYGTTKIVYGNRLSTPHSGNYFMPIANGTGGRCGLRPHVTYYYRQACLANRCNKPTLPTFHIWRRVWDSNPQNHSGPPVFRTGAVAIVPTLHVVWMAGFEPATSWFQAKNSTKLSYIQIRGPIKSQCPTPEYGLQAVHNLFGGG